MADRYGRERILKGLMHFLVGKAVSAIGGIIAMLLVVRLLPVQEFAAYSVLIALVEIFTAFTGLGIVHAILRYVPELYAKAYHHSLHLLVRNALFIRTAVLLLTVATTYFFASYMTPHIGLQGYEPVFKVFLIIVLLRTTTFFISQILESTLHQGDVQLAFTLGTLVRLFGVLAISNGFHLTASSLEDVIYVEILGEIVILMLMARGLYRVIDYDKVGSIDANDQNWIPRNWNTMLKFALSGYLQHLAILPYGSNTNRLVGGAMLAAHEMASFGFAQSIYEYIKRYLPAQLLVGLIRPIITARYTKSLDFSIANRICSQVMQINLLLIGMILVVVVVGGKEAVLALTAGKYGDRHAVYILIGLLLVLILETQRQQLELLAQTVERYEYLIFSNLFLALSVLLAILLITQFEAVAFPLANGLGLIIANYWVQLRLEQNGYFFKHDWKHTLGIILAGLISILIGLWVKNIASWTVGIMFSAVIYGLLVYFFMFEYFNRFMQELKRE